MSAAEARAELQYKIHKSSQKSV